MLAFHNIAHYHYDAAKNKRWSYLESLQPHTKTALAHVERTVRRALVLLPRRVRFLHHRLVSTSTSNEIRTTLRQYHRDAVPTPISRLFVTQSGSDHHTE